MKAFLRYYVELPHPAARVDDAINRLPADWIEEAAREAYLQAVLLLGAPAGLVGEGASLAVLLLPGQLDAGVSRRSLQWLTTQGTESKILLRGDLELAELGPARSQLALSAQYQPTTPCTDYEERMAAQRLGESTLKAFVDRIAGYVQAVLGDGAPSFIPRPSNGKLNVSAAQRTTI
jgi:hypothetical protein